MTSYKNVYDSMIHRSRLPLLFRRMCKDAVQATPALTPRHANASCKSTHFCVSVELQETVRSCRMSLQEISSERNLQSAIVPLNLIKQILNE
jgi:hypothetical protein